MATNEKSNCWLPSTGDKYIPALVIIIMVGAVYILSARMIAHLKEFKPSVPGTTADTPSMETQSVSSTAKEDKAQNQAAEKNLEGAKPAN